MELTELKDKVSSYIENITENLSFYTDKTAIEVYRSIQVDIDVYLENLQVVDSSLIGDTVAYVDTDIFITKELLYLPSEEMCKRIIEAYTWFNCACYLKEGKTDKHYDRFIELLNIEPSLTSLTKDRFTISRILDSNRYQYGTSSKFILEIEQYRVYRILLSKDWIIGDKRGMNTLNFLMLIDNNNDLLSVGTSTGSKLKIACENTINLLNDNINYYLDYSEWY